MALSVLVFHYDKWLTGNWDAASVQGRLGVYAVSVFFILSGLTLTLVYETRLHSTVQSWATFFRKRFYRIFPLLWMATAATLLLDKSPRPMGLVLLNFSGLFGFVNPAADVATGAWSIGCELVFYAAFPTLLLLAQRNRTVFLGFFGLFATLGVWIAFSWFSPLNTLQAQWWEAYVQAANHAFFFIGGMVVGVFRKATGGLPKWLWQWLLVWSVLLILVWPIGHEPYYLVSGWNRVLFSGLSLLAVVSYFNCRVETTGAAHRILAWLGAVSYSLYLWHPLVFRAVKSVFSKLGWQDAYWLLFLFALLIALIMSHLSYFLVEKPLAEKA